MERQEVERILAEIAIGCRLTQVEKLDRTWRFYFGGALTVDTDGLWRLLSHDRLAVSSEDHGQLFGLHAPLDAVERMAPILERAVTALEVVPAAFDLRIRFDADVLEMVTTSSGYEDWRVDCPRGELIVLGGGAFWGTLR